MCDLYWDLPPLRHLPFSFIAIADHMPFSNAIIYCHKRENMKNKFLNSMVEDE